MAEKDGPLRHIIAAQEADRIAAGFFTIEEAAHAVANSEGWNTNQERTLCEQMLEATRDGSMVARHPHTDLPVPPSKRASVRTFYELVTRDDVNDWLVSIRAPYRWRLAGVAESEPRLIGNRRLWRLSEAVDAVAEMPGFGVTRDAFLERAVRACASGDLVLTSPIDGEPERGDQLSGFLVEWVYAEAFNAWLGSSGFREPYRLADDAAAAVASTVRSEAPSNELVQPPAWTRDGHRVWELRAAIAELAFQREWSDYLREEMLERATQAATVGALVTRNMSLDGAEVRGDHHARMRNTGCFVFTDDVNQWLKDVEKAPYRLMDDDTSMVAPTFGVLTQPTPRTGDYLVTLHQWGELPDVVPVPDAARLLATLCEQNPHAILKVMEAAILAHEVRFWGLSHDGDWREGMVRILHAHRTKPKFKPETQTQNATFQFHLENGGRLHTEAMGINPAEAVALLAKRGRKIPDELKGLLPSAEEEPTKPEISARVAETAPQRRARLLEWFEAESDASGQRGAVERVFAREKQRRPTADRSNVGRDIQKARRDRDKAKRAGPFDGLVK